MTTTTKSIIAFVLAVIIGGAIYGAYLYPKATGMFGAASPAGTTFANTGFPSVTFSFATATSTSILNSNAYDLYVTSTKIMCNGVGVSNTPYTGTGLASWQFTVGTTSTNTFGTTATPSFANLMKGFAVSTSTGPLEVASSSLATATSSLAIIWPAGSYMSFQTNATNTAVCTIGVETAGS